MIYLKSKNVIFLHNKKNAGMSISYALMNIMKAYDIAIGGTPFGEYIQEKYISWYDINKHVSANKLRSFLTPMEYDQCKVFAVVRNPFDRVVSTYLFLRSKPLEGWNAHLWHDVKKMRISEFVMSDHLLWLDPQTSIIDRDIDYTIRYENLRQDWKKVCQLFNLGNLDLPYINKSTEIDYSYDMAKSILYLDKKAFNRIRTVYAKDYERYYPNVT